MLLGTSGASLLGNILAWKGITRADSGHPSSSTLYRHSLNSSALHENKKGKGIVRAGTGRCSLNSSTSYRPWDF